MCVGGDGQVSVNGNSEKIRQGETLLIPAENKNVQLSAENCELLEVYIK
jgi:mannose-6-phosphate isomerase